MELPCLFVGRGPGARGPGMVSAPGLGVGRMLRGGGRGFWVVGTQAESQFPISPYIPPPGAVKPSHFLPSVMGVSGEPLSFLAC